MTKALENARPMCRYPDCYQAGRGQWCSRHGAEIERTTPSNPRFDLDDDGKPEGEGDAICVFCNGRAPFRAGRFIFHESPLIHAMCMGVGRPAVRDGKALPKKPGPKPRAEAA